MAGVGRYAWIALALGVVLLSAACSDPSSDAYCDASARDNQQSLQFLNQVLERKRNNTGVYLARARCQYFLGSYAQAVQDASEVISRLPKQAEAHLIRAEAGKMLGQIAQALNDYSAAIRLHPTADAYYGRGLTYRGTFQDREALEDFTAAIGLDANHVGAYKSRAEIYSRHDQFQKALTDSEVVLKLDPATPQAYCNVGFAHYALGHDGEGRTFLTTCYQKDPDPQTRGYFETEIRKVLLARQPRGNSSGGMQH
jgi:tetratricopeptide (TPR) repeat protein